MALNAIVEAVTSAGYHARMAASFSAMAVKSAKGAAHFAELAEEHSRLAVEAAKPPAEPTEIAGPAEPADHVVIVKPWAAKPTEPAAKRQRTNSSDMELRAEDVEFLKQADKQAAEEAAKPHDAGEWDRYLDAGIDSHFQVEMSPSPLPLDSPYSPDWP